MVSACGALAPGGRQPGVPATGASPEAVAQSNLVAAQPRLSAPGGFGLAAPLALHAQLDAQRGASYVYEDLSQRGDEYEAGLPNQHIASSLGRLDLSPQWTSSSASTFADLAFAMFSFQLEGYDLSGAMSTDWLAPAAPGLAWIGFGNVVLNRWEWFALDAESLVLTPGFTDYIEAASHRMLVAVVVLGTKPAVLANLRLGSGISGLVLNTQGLPVGGAQVKLEGLAAVQADYKGEFSIWGLAAADPLVVNFTADGYMDNTRVYQVVPGRQRYERIVMLPRSNPVDLNCDAGGELAFPGPLGGSLTLPPGALEDHTGAALTGTAKAYLTFLDVSDPDQLAAAPGDFTAIQLDSSSEMLESFGMCEIRIADNLGGEAQLAAGQTAQLKLPIPPALQADAPATLGLYSFDKALCKWIEEDVLTKDGPGQFYEGTVGHFSTWNADLPEVQTCVRINVKNSKGQDVAGAMVVLFGDGIPSASSGFTGADGYVCLNALHNMPANVFAYYEGAMSEIKAVSTPPSEMRCSSAPGSCLHIKELKLRDPPEARLEASPDSGPIPLSVAFDASTTTEGDGLISKYEWDYDGAAGGYVWTSTGLIEQSNHTYDTPGDYFPTLRVTDENGLSDMAVLWLKVGGVSARGDWWMTGHDPQRTFCSNFIGPQTNHQVWTGDPTDDSVISSGIALAADGTIYLGDISKYLYAFKPANGNRKWRSEIMGDRSQCTPAVAHDGTVFMTSFNEKLYAFEPTAGAIAWSYQMLAGRDSPVIGADNTIYCGTFQKYAINPTDHTTQLWLQNDVMTNKCAALGRDGTLYAPQQDGRLAAFNPATGECIWQSLDVGMLTTPPAVGRDGMIYICGTDSLGQGALFAFNPGRGELQWTANTDGDRVWGEGPGIGPDDNLYIIDVYSGIAYSFNRLDGSRRWKSDHTGEASPYFYSCNPAIGADGTLYLGGGQKVHALEPFTGGDKWVSTAMDTYSSSTPAIAADGTLYVISENGTLYAFRDV